MTDEGTKITLRVGPDEIQQMEDFMAEHDIGNRSDFIRDAIKGYIALKTNGGTGDASDSGVYVRFNEQQMRMIENHVAMGEAYDAEDYVRSCTVREMITPEIKAEIAAKAYRDAGSV